MCGYNLSEHYAEDFALPLQPGDQGRHAGRKPGSLSASLVESDLDRDRGVAVGFFVSDSAAVFFGGADGRH